MMRIDIITAVPQLFESPLNNSILKNAQSKNLLNVVVHNLRDFVHDKHKQIDDKQFGGGAGMVLKPEPFFECVEKLLSERNYDKIIMTSPGGRRYDQKYANELSLDTNLLILAGHYKGIDDRVRERFVTHEISVGDYVLTGGEIPALLIVDSVVRLIPGVLHDSESALDDSFQDCGGISFPSYTRPVEYKGLRVPEVLLQGNHKKIKEWREEQSQILTQRWKKNNTTE